MEFQLEEVDTLTGLEERILRAVSVVSQLKQENADLKSRLAEAEDEARLANAARNRAESELAGLRANSGKAEKDLEELLAERKLVKARIEKLLGQLDLLGAS